MGFTVLIADDEAMSRAVLQGYIPWDSLSVTQVILATDGEEAVELARKFHPEIIVSDIKMPRKNGLEMAAVVRQFLPACQFVFLSGYSDKEYLKGAIKLKAASYVEKPIDLEEITDVLREVTEELTRNILPTPEEIFFQDSHLPGSPLNDTVFSIEKGFAEQLEKFIKQNNREETMNALRRTYEKISRCQGTSPEYLRHLYCRIIFIFLKAAESHNVKAVTSQADFLLYTTVKKETLSGLWETLYQTAQDYFSALDVEEPDITAQVEKHIENHYSNCSLTVQEIASDLGFTNTYLCTAYKKGCGKTINQRLTEIRISHAKELLLETDQKLYEVARAVGYADGKYFVKLFTQKTGLTPRQYRGRHPYEN